MHRSKAKATEEELEEARRLHKQAQETPVMAVSSEHALRHGGFSGDAWKWLEKRVHAMALEHGLPEQPGYYGLDTVTGEFLSTRPIIEPEVEP